LLQKFEASFMELNMRLQVLTSLPYLRSWQWL